MIINDAEILSLSRNAHLIGPFDENCISNCCYTLRVGSVYEPKSGHLLRLEPIDDENKKRTGVPSGWELGPTQVLIVKTKERVRLPLHLCASYAPLNRRASEGVMLLNASIVEPGYDGPLSCVLVNLSSSPVMIEPDAPVAKLVFHKLADAPASPKQLTLKDADYEKMLRELARKYQDSFMDVTGIENRAVEKARGSLKGVVLLAGGLIGVLVVFSQLEPFFAKWIYEKTGLVSTSQRVEDAKLAKDLAAATTAAKLILDKQISESQRGELQAEVSSLRKEVQSLKAQLQRGGASKKAQP